MQFDWLTAFWPITGDPEFCQIWWWNINNNVSFHFRLFPRKTNMTKFFKKIQKPPFWGHSVLLLPKFWQKWIFLEKMALPVFKYFNYLPLCQKSEKIKDRFLRKMLNCWTDRQQWIYRTLLWTGVQLLKQL